jgi:hypothetical protein
MKNKFLSFVSLALLAGASLSSLAQAEWVSWYYSCQPYGSDCWVKSNRDDVGCAQQNAAKEHYWTYVTQSTSESEPGAEADTYPVSWSELSSSVTGNYYAYTSSRGCDANTPASERLRYVFYRQTIPSVDFGNKITPH